MSGELLQTHLLELTVLCLEAEQQLLVLLDCPM